MPDLVLEIGTEEIPDWMIPGALDDLRTRFQATFAAFGGDSLRADGTPRRLVLQASNLAAQAPDSQSLVLGPYLSAGRPAAEGFARKNKVALENLNRASDSKGERYVIQQIVTGAKLAQSLSEKLPELVAGISFPKSMTWTGQGGARFIRPIRWLLVVLDDVTVPVEIAGVRSGNTTSGHRILGSTQPIAVSATTYEQTLRDNFVLLRASERSSRIAGALPPDVHHDDDLLQTLTYLTEYPSVVCGTFDPAFLELPREVLSTVMRHHQRYFSVLDADGNLAPRFVAVTNTDGDPDSLIRQGNERVLRARFNDARFFWMSDQRRKLADRVDDLAKVTWQAKLGSYKEKTERLVWLADQIAIELGADRDTVKRAALLSKCDLITDMVKEFTDLQGVVGGLYAAAQGETDAVAGAIYDQYKPVGMNDSIPRTLEGQIVAMADKFDTLRSSFAIGLIPTGSKDPFALRRAAQGIVKILFEAKLNWPLLRHASGIEGLEAFLRDRIAVYLRDTGGFAYDEVKAVLAVPVSGMSDLQERISAIHAIRATPDFEPLAASFKRIKNILRQADFASAVEIDDKLLTAGPEADLYREFKSVQQQARQAASYGEKLTLMATLRPGVDLFFDKILVNDPDPTVRLNRLALLSGLLFEFSNIADFAEIVTESANA